jgi:hypothetical protein
MNLKHRKEINELKETKECKEDNWLREMKLRNKNMRDGVKKTEVLW